jgi:hypothetical protein
MSHATQMCFVITMPHLRIWLILALTQRFRKRAPLSGAGTGSRTSSSALSFLLACFAVTGDVSRQPQGSSQVDFGAMMPHLMTTNGPPGFVVQGSCVVPVQVARDSN